MAKTPTGIRTRHSRSCATRDGARCNCNPSYEAFVYSRRDGTKIRRTFASLSEAKGWRADATAAVRKGTIQTPIRQTLREVGDAWLEGARRGEILSRGKRPYKPATLRGYKFDLTTYVYPDLGGVRLSELQARDFQALVDRLVGHGFSGSKVRNVLVPVQAIYRRHRRDVPVNPTADLDLPEPGGRRDRVASPAEAAQLLEALPEEDRALWATAFYAGLRRGELRALRWSDVDDGVTVIHVRRGWDDVEGEIDPKSRKGARKVPVSAALRLYLLKQKASTGRRGEDFVFGRTAGEPFTPTIVRRRALAAWAAAEPKPLTPIGLHECRHTYVSLMHAAGLSLERIGDYVGHSSSYMTDRYRHLLDGHEAEAATMLDDFLARSTRVPDSAVAGA